MTVRRMGIIISPNSDQGALPRGCCNPHDAQCSQVVYGKQVNRPKTDGKFYTAIAAGRVASHCLPDGGITAPSVAALPGDGRCPTVARGRRNILKSRPKLKQDATFLPQCDMNVALAGELRRKKA